MVYGTCSGRVPQLMQLAGQKMAQNQTAESIIRLFTPLISFWICLGLGSYQLGEYLDLKGGLRGLYHDCGTEHFSLLLYRIYELMEQSGRLRRHFEKFKLDLAKSGTFLYHNNFYQHGLGLVFFQPRSLCDITQYCRVSKAGRFINLNAGWVPQMVNSAQQDFVPLPLEENIKRLLQIRHIRASPKPESNQHNVPADESEANMFAAWTRYNQHCYYESLIWSCAALSKSIYSHSVDNLVLVSNNVARLSLSPNICHLLLTIAAKKAVNTISEWDIVLGLQVYCASFGFLKEEWALFNRTLNLPSVSAIRQKAFAVHLESQIEWCENQLLIVMCNREFHCLCNQRLICQRRQKSQHRVWTVGKCLKSLEHVVRKERHLSDVERIYWESLILLLKGATAALKHSSWANKTAKVLSEDGRIKLFMIRNRFGLHYKRMDEVRVLCTAFQNLDMKFRFDSILVFDRLQQLSGKEMVSASPRSVSVILRLTLLFQLFCNRPDNAIVFDSLLMRAKRMTELMPGRWYRQGLVNSLYRVFVQNRVCTLQLRKKMVAEVRGHKMARPDLKWIREKVPKEFEERKNVDDNQEPKLVRPTWEDLVEMDPNFRTCLTIGHYSTRLRPEGVNRIGFVDSVRESSEDEY